VSDGGTIFLDEIGDMSPTMQVKLLRVLQDRRIRPVGGTEEIAVDVRVIAATNRNLQKMVAEKSFREDLFYRLSVIPVHVPPLRERREDIRALTDHFIKRFCNAMGKKIAGVEPDVYETLEAYEWPGNVRELENTIERAVAFESTETLKLERLPERIVMPQIKIPEIEASFPLDGIDFDQQISEVEKKLLEAALRKADGVQTKAAELLKMTYRSFRHYMAKYNIQK
jgi:two-component system, NtrC family, response regulator PilR